MQAKPLIRDCLAQVVLHFLPADHSRIHHGIENHRFTAVGSLCLVHGEISVM